MWQEQEPQRPHLRCRPVLQQTLSHWGWISSLFLSGRRGWGPQSEVLPGRGKWADHSRRQVIQVDNTPRHSSLDAPPKPIQDYNHKPCHNTLLYRHRAQESYTNSLTIRPSLFSLSRKSTGGLLWETVFPTTRGTAMLMISTTTKTRCQSFGACVNPVMWVYEMCINLHFQVTIRNQICAALPIDVHTIMQCTILLGVGLWKIW